MSAVLFGSISTLADTSEIQRQAFNEAFRTHGLDWQWDQDSYRHQLAGNGGRDRIAEYAASRGEDVDADAVHKTKSAIFQKRLGDAELSPRPGVLDVIAAARDGGWKVALVTTTSPGNVAALLDALSRHLGRDDFQLVTTVDDVDDPKPDSAIYTHAVRRLGESESGCIAIEDNLGGVSSAVAAGVMCIAFPNENTAGHDFAAADLTVDHLDPAELRSLLASQ
jgi:HAD superfamily hydrolase (TIGR01509 family)